MFGRVYVVCQPCQRFVGVGAWLDGLDTRVVTFSCAVCGGPGKLTFEDPAKEGLQHDLRANPPRHPSVSARLRQAQALGNQRGRKLAVARDLLPQTERPRFVPEPRYRLRPMPFRLFGELPRAGLALQVWCSRCKTSKRVKIDDRMARRCFGRLRFTCSSQPHEGDKCGGLGHPHVVPMAQIEKGLAFVSLNCPRCVPPWSASPVILWKTPWVTAPLDAKTERYRCPGCGGQVVATFHAAPAGS